MARAGLIELVALTARASGGDETPQTFGDATHAAIRICDDGHRDAEVFNACMAQARQDVRHAAERGFAAIQAVATADVEISEALHEMYSVTQGAWVPITVCCGGCPVHWTDRGEHVHYRPPVAPRLPRFAHRSLVALERLALTKAAPNLLLIDVSPGLDYAETCAGLVTLLAPAVECHTVALERSFARLHISVIERALPRVVRASVFIDVVDADAPEQWPAGEGEVRIVIWGNEQSQCVPDALRLSEADLEILVIPSELPHPHHPARRFIETTPHVHALDLLHLITS
jgi:hypothetical protein